jgi:hypothetical protein
MMPDRRQIGRDTCHGISISSIVNPP